MDDTSFLINAPLAELHAHIATSIPPSVYWHIAQSEGFKLPRRDFHEFKEYIQLSPERKMTLKEYLDDIYHPLLDRLSSGSIAVEKAVYETFSGAYRSSNIHVMELRGNPMKHNRDGEVDLDHVIMALLRGMEKALLEYPKLRGGIIFTMDRQFSFEKNEIILEKAIKYHRRGVVGVDFANYNGESFHYKDYKDLLKRAREAGLKITSHSGETVDTNDMWECVEFAQPDRIGHGIKAAYDTELMKELVKRNITLEVCPLSNLMTKAVKDLDELRFIIRTLWDNGVKFCINTDWPETIKDGQLPQQLEFLIRHDILGESEIKQLITWGFEASFVPKDIKTNLYL